MRIKNNILICFAALLIGLVGIYGCKGDAGKNAAANCTTTCHSEDSATGLQVLAAEAGYENSGHFNGPRLLEVWDMTDPDDLISEYAFEGSNANYANGLSYGSPCQYCHTHQGFVEYVSEGSTADLETPPAGSQIQCFTCHAPHDNGNFSLRTETAVTLIDDTTSYDGGAGNLCINCHRARTAVDDALTDAAWTADPTAWVEISSHWGAHHGPQAEMIAGINAWVPTGETSAGASSHYTTNAADTCVTCHHYLGTSRLSLSLEFGGHGFYLTGDVHGNRKDLNKVCSDSCHSSFSGDLFEEISNGTAQNWDNAAGTTTLLEEIEGMTQLLVAYFGTGTNFSPDGIAGGAAGDGALVDTTTGLDVASGAWQADWKFNDTYMSQYQAQAFWNFKVVIEDHSKGVHNPSLTAQMLYDAIVNLNTNEGAGITMGAGVTRP